MVAMEMHSLVFSTNINVKSHCLLDYNGAFHVDFVGPF